MMTRIVVGIAVCLVGLALLGLTLDPNAVKSPIKVGILHSFSGTMSVTERLAVDATLLAIEEINAQGGVLGRQVRPIVADGCSDGKSYRLEAERLMIQERTSVLFGCWTSGSRRSVRPSLERLGGLLFYPVPYEGLEESPNIVYLGATPNQQIIPALSWCVSNLGNRFFIVGSDDAFSRIAGQIARDGIGSLGGTIVGEHDLPLDSRDFQAVVGFIRQMKPDVILNTLTGNSNLTFFRELRASDLSSEVVPTVSFRVTEQELLNPDPPVAGGDYVVGSYFSSLPGEVNQQFIARFRARYGSTRQPSDPIESAYIGVYLWAQGVEDARSFDPTSVRKVIGRQSVDAPGGVVCIDPETQHAWKTARIGRLGSDGQVQVVWSSPGPIRPTPYPCFRSRAAWDDTVVGLQAKWGGAWARPTP